MTRRPPSSTLFPSRRSSDLPARFRRARLHHAAAARRSLPHDAAGAARQVDRSEEHTSELQSLTNLVCRLLLEKKKDGEFAAEESVTVIRPRQLIITNLRNRG